jgi:hypothetical protein
MQIKVHQPLKITYLIVLIILIHSSITLGALSLEKVEMGMVSIATAVQLNMLLLIAAARLVTVYLKPETLDSVVPIWQINMLRKLGLVLMFLTVSLYSLSFISWVLQFRVDGNLANPSSAILPLGIYGICMLEVSRLLGFEISRVKQTNS